MVRALWLIGLAAGVLSAQDRAAISVPPSVRIGEGEAREFAFSRISGLGLDTNGYLYVSDAQEDRVDVFALDGRHLATIGRRGQGPGEFRYPTSLAISPAGDLLVRDQSRLQRFTRPEASSPATRFVAVVTALGMYDWMSQRAGVIDRDGTFHAPRSYSTGRSDVQTHHQMIVRIAPDGAARDSLVAPQYPDQPAPYARVMLSASSGRMLNGLGYAPFSPIRIWASTVRGTIISGDARSYLLVETDGRGRELRRFARAWTPVAIDAQERRDSLRAMRGRLDSIPVPLSEVQGMSNEVRAGRLPEVYPAYRELAVSAEGVLWVRRWSRAGERGRSVFDIFDEEARFLGTLAVSAELRADPVLVIRGGYAAGVESDPETGLERIVRFTVPAAFRGETRSPSRP